MVFKRDKAKSYTLNLRVLKLIYREETFVTFSGLFKDGSGADVGSLSSTLSKICETRLFESTENSERKCYFAPIVVSVEGVIVPGFKLVIVIGQSLKVLLKARGMGGEGVPPSI